MARLCLCRKVTSILPNTIWTTTTTTINNIGRMPAMKLTTTVGNVRSPKLHPTLPLVAFTATYAARREAYLLDLSNGSQKPGAVRLTHANHVHGVSSIAGWKNDDTLVLSATSNTVSLPDTRLYELTLQSSSTSASTGPTVLQVTPVPLAQAVSGVFDSSTGAATAAAAAGDAADYCVYFVRVQQSSQTIRYVGGTAEQLWAYCHNEAVAIPLTRNDYIGTSKAASIMQTAAGPYLLFMSDRSLEDGEWIPTTMNLWAAPLPTRADLYGSTSSSSAPATSATATPAYSMTNLVQLTHVSCQHNGRSLIEYSLDPVTSNVVLRIGADLHLLAAADIRQRLQAGAAAAAVGMVATPRLPVAVYSDFREQQERIIEIDMTKHMVGADVYETAFGSTAMLLAVRGQLWVAPVIDDVQAVQPYSGAGQNMPPRRYRVVPGAMTGGAVRVLNVAHVPLLAEKHSARRLALVLATDPISPTAEHAFYLVETQTDSLSSFADLEHLPEPLLGGHKNGGSTAQGGLGSIDAESLTVSPCGRRAAWSDTDGRICVMTLPVGNTTGPIRPASYTVLPDENELGESMMGLEVDLKWSPGGRYLGVSHNARNQFRVISIVDCGSPHGEDPDEIVEIEVGRIAQATPSRFNSQDMVWGKSPFDIDDYEQKKDLAKTKDEPEPEDVATTLYFLTDRDITTTVTSPWGTRAPAPYFPGESVVYALPLMPKAVAGETEDASRGRYSGGGAAEVFVDDMLALDREMEALDKEDEDRRLTKVFKSLTQAVGRRRRTRQADKTARHLATSPTAAPTALKDKKSSYPKDADIDFGTQDLTFARRAHRMAGIPKGSYHGIISQTLDDASLVLIAEEDDELVLQIFSADEFPSDFLDSDIVSVKGLKLAEAGLSTTREHIFLVFAPAGVTRVVRNTNSGLMGLLKDDELTKHVADTDDWGISVWPTLEYKQMYNDAWRLLRDYFYDKDMTGLDWPAIHERYMSMVQRCAKREELDDVLEQLAAELSALHVFVYGGETNSPSDTVPTKLNSPASLGANLARAAEWKGYLVSEIPLRDPDFNSLEGEAVYSPLSDQALGPSGQVGLQVGDVIVGVNGESVMSVPDIHMLLRGMAGRSVRLEVLRFASGAQNATGTAPNQAATEPLLVVPITQDAAATLRYNAWEWKTRQTAKTLAAQAGFSVGYVHLQEMGREDMDAFARGYFPDYDKQTLILDVRHNRGGNIDSWILGILQRKAWQYWGGRTGVKRKGDMDWDEQFAFRGHIVVLIDEKTSSDGEGVSRGMSELGLGRLIGTRTWGGGIWLGSDNRLVDDGIATAPEIGTFNENFGWGLGIEQIGVMPDIVVDNNPRTAFDGKDTQLERAIAELKQWLQDEPVVVPKPMAAKSDMSLHGENCPA